jgi:hypothetical protein
MPEKKEDESVVDAEPASYQPLTRKERRSLENADAPALEPMSDLFEEEFEFQTAPAASSRSYAPGKDEAAKRREIPVIDEVAPPIAEVSLFNGFEDVFPQQQEPEAPEAENAESDWDENSLPSLDMGDSFSSVAPAVPSPAVPVPSNENDENSFLPTLGGSSDFVNESLPSLESMDREYIEPADDEEEDDFFASSSIADAEEEPLVEDDFIAVAPVTVTRKPYEAPPVEAKAETPTVTRRSYEAPPVANKAEVKKSPERDEMSTASSPAVPPAVIRVKEPEASVVDTADSVPLDADEQPSFGFTSKLGRSFKKEDDAENVPVAIVPRAAPKSEEKSPAHHVEVDEDDSEDEGVQRDGIGGRFKSFFGKGRSQDVLDYDYEDMDERSEADDLPKPEPKPKSELKAADTTPKATASIARVESDEPEEEPTIKTGIFSSRQDKEDAAVEVELVDRLNSLAKRVASLKQEEIEVLARVKAAKAQESTLNELIIHAHETHELLDQLAKTRQKEIEGSRDEKETENFMELLESHASTDVEDETDFEINRESTVALPVIKGGPEKEDDESETSPLPELKFN